MIRPATIHDTDAIIDMMRNYAQASPVPALRLYQNPVHVRTLVTMILSGLGGIWLSENRGKMCGLIIAIRNPNPWNPDIMLAQELAFWVEPDYRNSTHGYKLLRAYEEWAQAEVAAGRVHGYTVSRMATSEFDPANHGYTLLEATYIKENK